MSSRPDCNLCNTPIAMGSCKCGECWFGDVVWIEGKAVKVEERPKVRTFEDKLANVKKRMADAEPYREVWSDEFIVMDEMLKTLDKVQRVFRHYELLHRAKPDHEKADKNAALAVECEKFL